MERKPMSSSHLQTESRYRQFRDIIYRRTMQAYPGVIARGISLRDCVTADKWVDLPHDENHRPHRATWDWTPFFSKYQNIPNRFEISLWAGSTLCALSYGQTSRAGTKVRLNLLGSIPVKPNPLGQRSLPIIVSAAVIFSELVGADEIWVIDPNPDLESYYKETGFGERETYHQNRVGQKLR